LANTSAAYGEMSASPFSPAPMPLERPVFRDRTWKPSTPRPDGYGKHCRCRQSGFSSQAQYRIASEHCGTRGNPADSWIIAACPLCKETRRHLPSEIFRARLLHGYDQPCGGLTVFDPYRNIPRINRGMVYLGACRDTGHCDFARSNSAPTRVVVELLRVMRLQGGQVLSGWKGRWRPSRHPVRCPMRRLRKRLKNDYLSKLAKAPMPQYSGF